MTAAAVVAQVMMFLFAAITTRVMGSLMAISTDVIVPGDIQVWSMT